MTAQHSSTNQAGGGWRDPWVWVVFALALGLRLSYLADFRHTPFFAAPQMDALYHDQWARRLAAGDWVGTGVFFRAPLYPYFLGTLYALLGPAYGAVHVVQLVLGAGTALLTTLIAYRRFGRIAGIVAGLLTAFHGPLIFFEGELLLVVLEAPLNLATAWALDRALSGGTARGWIRAGAFLGLCALTRPTILALVPVVAIHLAWRRGRQAWRPLAIYVGTLLAVLAPVLVRNAVVGGDFVPVASQGGLNYYLGNHRGADGMSAVAPEFRRTWTGGLEDANRLAELAAGRPLKPSEVSDYWFGRALAWAQEAPGAFLRLQLKKAALLWDAFEIPNNEDYYFFSRLTRVFRANVLSHFGILGPLALAGLAFGILRRRAPFAWVAVPGVLGAVIAAFFVCGRFRASLVPLFAVWAGLGVSRALACVRARSLGEVLLYVLVLAAGVMGMNADPWSLRRSYSPAESHLRLGIHCAAAGDETHALEHYRAAVGAEPGFADGWNNLGVLQAQMGRPVEAREAFERALAARHDHAKALGNLAALAFGEGRRGEADSLAHRALRAPGWEPEAIYNAAVVLGNLGRAEDALAGFRALRKREPGNAAARVGEARALLLLGRRDEAREILRGHPPESRSRDLESLLKEIDR